MKTVINILLAVLMLAGALIASGFRQAQPTMMLR